MKKIFRMALVFALAGATLMYTSCSKDYGEDIDNLDKKLTSVQSDLSTKLSDLEGRLSTLSSSVNALDAAYKAADSALDGKISGLNSDLSGLKTRVSAIEDAIKDLDKLASKAELKDVKEALEKKINDDIEAAKAVVLAMAENLQDQINVINEALKLKADADKVYTKDEVDAILAKYYTQEQIDAFLATKADKDAVFTKDEVIAFLAEKADKSAVYTKEEIAKILEDYFTKEQVNELLAKKADKDAVYTKEEIAEILTSYFTKEEVVKMLEDYYTKAEIAELLAKYYTKAEIDELIAKYYTKDEVDGLLKNYFTKEEIEAMFAKYYTKDEVDKILENYYTKEEVYTKAEIEALLAKYYTKEEIDAMFAKYYTKEEVDTLLAAYYNKEEIDALLAKKADKEEMEAKLKEAQEKLDEVFAILSDELRSIVFLPDLYFAGIEATSYDFGAFVGLEIVPVFNMFGDGWSDYFPAFENGEYEGEGVEATVLNLAPYYAIPYVITDKDGNIVYFKLDPETGDFARDEKGELIVAKNSDNLKAPYFPGNHVQGQVGKAKYNLNPSSFAVADAEWSLEGRNVKYVVKSGEPVIGDWAPVFEGITKDADGLATVDYSIEHPEWLFSSILGGIVEGAISWIGTIYKFIEGPDYPYQLREGSVDNWYEFMQRIEAAFAYEFNNIPTMHLVGTLGDGRRIVSDWHAISSFEEVVEHLAFRDDNPWVVDHETYLEYYDEDEDDFEDCGLGLSGKAKDLYPNAWYALAGAPSVKAKYNGGPIDLAELIAIHTMDYDSNMPYKSYTLEEFTEKYPGYHFEFAAVPYTNGNYDTAENYYGQLEGSIFTPCYVKSVDKKPVSVPIKKDDTSIEGISAVGRMPMYLVTLVNDETGIVQAAGWFRILIVKDVKEPRFFELPELPKVPYICGDFALYTEWHEFSFFVLEALGMDYKQFIKVYEFDGIWAYTNNGKKFQQVNNADDELYIDGKYWGEAYYDYDYSGTGINDAFWWEVNPQGLGEGATQTIYWRFHNGEDVVYFAMTATVAQRAKMDFVSNKMNKEWFDDITDAIPQNTVRLNVPVPTADKTSPVIGGDVMKFQRDINHWFVGYKPILALDKENSDPVYQKFFNTKNGNDPDAMYGWGYDDGELYTITDFYFDQKQPKINGNQLYTNWWGPVTVNGQSYAQSKLLYVVGKASTYQDLPVYDENGDPDYDNIVNVPYPQKDNLIAWIMPRVLDDTAVDAFGGPRASDTLLYLATSKSKELLNLWSYKETDEAKMLYANILAKSTYGSCQIELPDGLFHVRFIRPLDVNFKNLDVAEESAVDGWNVLLAKFLSDITDWNNQDVIVPRPEYDDNGKPKKDSKGNIIYTDYFMPNVIKTVDMFAYYGFTSMKIDLSKAEITNWNQSDPNAWGKVSEKVPEARLAIGTVDEATGKFTPTTTTTYTLTFNGSLEGMDGMYLNYRNDEAYSDTFKLRIPVEVEYAWGKLTAKIQVNVKDTGSTTPGE